MSSSDKIVRSKQDELDSKANSKLSNLIDNKYIKTLPINGNYPGIDWIIQFVDNNRGYTSKYLHSQIKGKEKAKDLIFPCEVKHLNSWAESNVPLIFILVDIDSGRAYWEKIDREYVSKLDIKKGQQTKTIQLDPSKEISAATNYVDEWFQIASTVETEEMSQSDWDKTIQKVNDNQKDFIALLHLIGPVSEKDKDALRGLKTLMGIDNRTLQLLVYEGIKSKLLKSVGDVLLVADQNYGADALTELSEKDFGKVMNVWKIVKDTKQSSTILKMLLPIKSTGAEKFLQELAKSFEDIVKEWKNNDVVFETVSLLDEIAYKTSDTTLEIIKTIVEKKNPPDSRKLKAGVFEYDGKSYEEVLSKTLDVARKIRYYKPKEILELLWKLSKDTKSNKIRKETDEIIKDLSAYDLHALRKIGYFPQTKVLELLESLATKELITNIVILQTITRELISASFEGHEMKDYKTFTWSSGALRVSDDLKKIRNRAISLLQKAYLATDEYASRRTIIKTLIEATYPPRQGTYGQDVVDMVTVDANSIVDFYISILGKTDKALYKDIEDQIHWLRKRFKPDAIKNLNQLTSLIVDDTEYEMFRVFIGYDYDFDEDMDWRKAKASRESKIQDFVKNVDEKNLEEWKKKISSITKNYSGVNHGEYQYFSSFLYELGKQKPQIAMKIITDLESELKPFLLHIMAGFWETNPTILMPFIEDCIKQGKYLTECAYIFTYTKTLDEKLLHKIFKKAVSITDTNALINIIRVCADNYNLKKSEELKKMLLDSLEVLTKEKNTHWIQRFLFREKTILSDLTEEESEIIISNMIEARSIDYDAEEILSPIAEKYPSKVVDLFKHRVAKHLLEKDYFKYDAVPYELHKLGEPLQKNKDAVIKSILPWFEEKDGLYSLEASHLLQIIFPSFDKVLKDALIMMIDEGGKENARIVLGVLSAYKGEIFLHEVAKHFIKKYLKDETGKEYRGYRTDLFIILSQMGVVWGEYGLADGYSSKKDAVQAWENEKDPRIVKFLTQYKDYLNKSIEFEKKRADVDIELFKRG